MASSSSYNLTAAAFEPNFLFRHSFPDSWISEAYARDTETLTRALQSTFTHNFDPTSSNSNLSFSDSDSLITNQHLLNLISSDSPTTASPPTPTASNISAGSDFETAPPNPVSNKRRRITNPSGDATVKASKRKSRASKKSQTTFITADPANFRQMVQQVTGVRFCSSQLPVVPVLKPEPQRLTNRFHGTGAGGCLPTLDTSAFLLDQHQQQMVMGSLSGSGSGSFAQTVLGDGGSGVGLDLDCISSFPTLESFHGKLCDI